LQEGQYEDTVPTVADRIAQTVVAMQLEQWVALLADGLVDSYTCSSIRSFLEGGSGCFRTGRNAQTRE
jgi:hypothetical protein